MENEEAVHDFVLKIIEKLFMHTDDMHNNVFIYVLYYSIGIHLHYS